MGDAQDLEVEIRRAKDTTVALEKIDTTRTEIDLKLAEKSEEIYQGSHQEYRSLKMMEVKDIVESWKGKTFVSTADLMLLAKAKGVI